MQSLDVAGKVLFTVHLHRHVFYSCNILSDIWIEVHFTNYWLYRVFMQLDPVWLFFIIANSASFVTCCMSLTQQTFCVSALYMFLALYFFSFYSLEALTADEWPTRLYTEPGLLYSRQKTQKKKQTSGFFCWPCIRLRSYSIWCAICAIWMLLVYLCSQHAPRDKLLA